ncbi:hypothetical protein NQ318_013724 [Aromia moschata]|uniref:Uncharacterized protein n=1 Tax=Aromia moschata TaxID=1265417 RepID=A0AAV8Z8D4_9CUCU|nr:hypothetical protein NQ318_013724 [Aromia moschata]
MVPKLLTSEQKESRMNICSDILTNIDTDPGLLDTVGSTFLNYQDCLERDLILIEFLHYYLQHNALINDQVPSLSPWWQASDANVFTLYIPGIADFAPSVSVNKFNP